jgi:hypothetical protein
VTSSHSLSPAITLAQQRGKGQAQEPAERGVDRGLVSDSGFLQPAVADREIIFSRPGFDLKQLDAATATGPPAGGIFSTPVAPCCIQRPASRSSPARRSASATRRRAAFSTESEPVQKPCPNPS